MRRDVREHVRYPSRYLTRCEGPKPPRTGTWRVPPRSRSVGPQGGVLLTSPEGVLHTKAFVELLLAQPELVDRLLRCRAVEAARRAGKALEVEYGWGGSSEHELLEPIFADLEPDARAYFTETLEDGVSAYYFDGYGTT